MCGIIGVCSFNGLGEPLGRLLKKSLTKLEYRGYDSVGVAVINGKTLIVRKGRGKIGEVDSRIKFSELDGLIGIGHTRWATHGKPSDENAHPHIDCEGRVAVVHNGIISNYRELKAELERRGHVFRSETDTEVIAHLIEENLRSGANAFEAFKKSIASLKGAYALVTIIRDEPDKLFFVRNISPLVIGLGSGANFIASDIPAFLEYTNTIVVINDGEYGFVTPTTAHVERGGVPINIEERIRHITWSPEMASKEGYPHFMLKEIHEQPIALRNTLAGIEKEAMNKIGKELADSRRIFITASGTSLHAGLVGEYLLTTIAGMDVHSFTSSEYRKYVKLAGEGDTAIVISQSGETIDALLALRALKAAGVKIIAISNVMDSAIPRESHAAIYTRTGPEIGVAATKTFTSQLMVLTMLAMNTAAARDLIQLSELDDAINQLEQVPDLAQLTLANYEARIKRLAIDISKASSMYYLGRGLGLPISMEGALKMKEVAYIHAEAYPAGESKHGPIALVEKAFPVVFTIFNDEYNEAMEGNIMEMRARDAYTIGIVPKSLSNRMEKLLDVTIPINIEKPAAATMVYAIPMQLLAYYTAVSKGLDPDKPRNLAKTVTVE